MNFIKSFADYEYEFTKTLWLIVMIQKFSVRFNFDIVCRGADRIRCSKTLQVPTGLINWNTIWIQLNRVISFNELHTVIINTVHGIYKVLPILVRSI